MKVFRETALILWDRADRAFRTGITIMDAGVYANFDHLNRMAETKNLQDVIHL